MKKRQTILCGLFAVIFALTFAACPEEDDGDNGKGKTPPAGISVPGSTLAEKLIWVKNTDNVEDGKTYVIKVDADESITPTQLSYTSLSNVTIILWADGEEKFISLSSNGNIFSVGRGVTLVLDNNITLEGKSGNNNSAVNVNNLGTLEMREGAKITGNTASSGAGGVGVSSGGTFTMNGGEISGNTAARSTLGYGGGVDIFGTFTMNGGVISGNTTAVSGGGVYVNGGGLFSNDGSFTMNGGVISGNTAATSGGGVYSVGTFRIVNGTVYGSDETNASLKNTAGSGAALYVGISTGTAQHGTFNDDKTWNSAGALTTTNDTIKVANGALQ